MLEFYFTKKCISTRRYRWLKLKTLWFDWISKQISYVYEASYWIISLRGGVAETMLCEFDLDGRDWLKNVLNRQEITRSVCEKKNLDQKVLLEKKIEHFSEKKYYPLRLRIFKPVPAIFHREPLAIIPRGTGHLAGNCISELNEYFLWDRCCCKDLSDLLFRSGTQ